MDVVRLLERTGGVAGRARLVALTSRKAVDRALRRGRIVRDAYGRYALTTADEALRRANALTALVGLRSAATYWGWEQKFPPEQPELVVPRNRTLRPGRRDGVVVHWIDVDRRHVHAGIVTDRTTTLVHCLRHLPFDEALAIADSALRHRDIDPAGLTALAAGLAGPGSAQARRVARDADGRAANPFESVLRAIALDVPGLSVVPQQLIGDGETVRPDLVDEALRVVLEADSHTWHGDRRGFRRDCRRYNWLVRRGWLVLRFAWEDVMFDPAYVRSCLEDVVALAARRAQRRRSARKAA